MKPDKSYSANELRARRSALSRTAANTVYGADGVSNAKIAAIKLQLTCGSYLIDTDVLAAKLLAQRIH